ncbi:MAG: hypothetical protein GY938_10390, partial [Ketobacter sp.]|nr:hypothetical protein [Ketobacter sp.]
SRTSVTETIAMAPQAKYWATPAQAEGHEEHWKTAHSHNYPFMLYNPDPEAPGAPPRMGAADIPIALIQESQISAEEINMVTGIYQADVGGASQTTSGRHEIAKQHAGSLATFNYQDNLANAVEYTYEILIDLIPKVYDTQRSIRVLGADDAEKFVMVNAVGDDEVIAHDLTVGKYDVTVKTGPNFTTKRQEAADTYQGLLQGNPEMFPLIGDLIFKSMDLPYAEEIAQRLRVMAPEPIQQMLNDETELPPEVMAAMQQAEMAMGQVQEMMAEAVKAANQAEIDKAEVEKLIANLKTEQARFEAKIAKELAKLATIEANMTQKALTDSSEGVIEQSRQQVAEEAQEFNAVVVNEISQGVQAIQAMSAEFNAQAVEIVDQIRQEKDEKPRIKEIVSERVNGQLKAVPVYEDDPTIN